jgi:hypothetical protein
VIPLSEQSRNGRLLLAPELASVTFIILGAFGVRLRGIRPRDSRIIARRLAPP